MPIPRASHAVAVSNDRQVSDGAATSRSIVTDSGQLLYDFRSPGIKNWPMACNAPRRLESALVSQRPSGRDAIGGPSILFPTSGPWVGSGGSSVVFAYRAVVLTTRFVWTPCWQQCLPLGA